MPLTSILDSAAALVPGQAERLAEERADADALLPFATVLSETLSLLIPGGGEAKAETVSPQASEETDAETAVPLGQGQLPAHSEPMPTDQTSSLVEKTLSSTASVAVAAGQNEIRPDGRPVPLTLPQDQATQGAPSRTRVAAPAQRGREAGATDLAAPSRYTQAMPSSDTPGKVAMPGASSMPEPDAETLIPPATPGTQASATEGSRIETSAEVAPPPEGVVEKDQPIRHREEQHSRPTLNVSAKQDAAGIEQARASEADRAMPQTANDPLETEQATTSEPRQQTPQTTQADRVEGVRSTVPNAKGVGYVSRPERGRALPQTTRLEVNRKTNPVEQPAAQSTQPLVDESEAMTAGGVAAGEPANTVPDLDAPLPEPDLAVTEKRTDTPASSREKAAVVDFDGAGVSADSGGDSEPREDASGRARRAHRAEREQTTPGKSEQVEAKGARTQGGNAPTPVDLSEALPAHADAEEALLPDHVPDRALTEEYVPAPATDSLASEAPAGRARAARGLFQQNRAVPLAWLRAVVNNARQTVFSQDGWNVMEMNLGEGEGTVTIKARREEGRMAVAVGFSDPELRALASAQADRLQEALQAEYETAVDFSLFSGNTGDSGGRQQAEHAHTPGAGALGEAAADIPDRHSVRRALPAGVQHEWVG